MRESERGREKKMRGKGERKSETERELHCSPGFLSKMQCQLHPAVLVVATIPDSPRLVPSSASQHSIHERLRRAVCDSMRVLKDTVDRHKSGDAHICFRSAHF